MELICLGDSLTFGYGVHRAQCWTSLAEQKSGWTLLNCGINGDTTGGMLVRLREFLSHSKGSSVERCFLLMGGSNDVFYTGSCTSAKENTAAMVHQLLAAGEIPIVAFGPGPAGGGYPEEWCSMANFPRAEESIRAFYTWLECFCRVFGLRMVDFRPDFLDSRAQPRRELYLDGLHPNAEGHRLMAERLVKMLSAMERGRTDV